MTNKYVFQYFPVKGLGNMVLILLEDQGLPYTFRAVDPANWPNEKKETPLGQVPVLHVNGTHKIGQSHSIARYLGREHGLMGSNNLEQATIEMWIDQSADVRKSFMKMIYSDYEKGLQPFLESLPTQLAPFDKQVETSGDTEHLLLGKVTVVDYILYDLLHTLDALSPGYLDKLPHLKAYYEKFGSREKLKAYLNKPEVKAMKYTGSGHL